MRFNPAYFEIPPFAPKVWKGKIIFIYSNPDRIAESVLHVSLANRLWGFWHFNHVETSDLMWHRRICGTTNQTLEDNLLSCDALGIEEHLRQWLSLERCPLEESCILAVKYEHLWDQDVIDIITAFCGIDHLPLQERNPGRGYPLDSLSEKERLMRVTYNLGTEQEPLYAAYDGARAIWENSPKTEAYRLPLDK